MTRHRLSWAQLTATLSLTSEAIKGGYESCGSPLTWDNPIQFSLTFADRARSSVPMLLDPSQRATTSERVGRGVPVNIIRTFRTLDDWVR
jgi:hypothetical protein